MYDIDTLPEYEFNSFARWVIKATEEYFKDPEVQRRFKKWQKEKREKEKKQKQESEVKIS